MPNSTRETVLCRYHYDPLDRQNGCTVLQQPAIQHFHCKGRLATEIQGAVRSSILQHDGQPLAELKQLDTKVTSTLLATDAQHSVLNALDATQPNPLAYSPYGHRPAKNGLLSLFGFNGERPDPVTGHYHLGNGYRQFNPVLMRFNSPDSWSPFGKGGLNAYTYCMGDPVNRSDPSGHLWSVFIALARSFSAPPLTRVRAARQVLPPPATRGIAGRLNGHTVPQTIPGLPPAYRDVFPDGPPPTYYDEMLYGGPPPSSRYPRAIDLPPTYDELYPPGPPPSYDDIVHSGTHQRYDNTYSSQRSAHQREAPSPTTTDSPTSTNANVRSGVSNQQRRQNH